MPGTGAIDFPRVMRAIAANDDPGWLTVELYPYLDDPDGAGSAAIEFLRPLLPAR